MTKPVTPEAVGVLSSLAPASLTKLGRRKVELALNETTMATIVACGHRQFGEEETASFLGVTYNYLRGWFNRHPEAKEAFVLAKMQGTSMLRAWQFREAQKGNVTVLIWLGRQYLGQKDQHDIGGVVPIRPTGAKSKLEEAVERERDAAKREDPGENAAEPGALPPRRTH